MKVSVNLQEMVLNLGVKEGSHSNFCNVLNVVVKTMVIIKESYFTWDKTASFSHINEARIVSR